MFKFSLTSVTNSQQRLRDKLMRCDFCSWSVKRIIINAARKEEICLFCYFFFCIWKNVREKNHSLPSISAKAQATQRFNNLTALSNVTKVSRVLAESLLFVRLIKKKTLQRPKVMFVVPTFVMIHPLLRNQLQSPRDHTMPVIGFSFGFDDL